MRCRAGPRNPRPSYTAASEFPGARTALARRRRRDVMVSGTQSQGIGGSELRLEVLEALDVRVAADVLAADEDVGHGALVGELLQRGLDLRAVVDLVQLERVVLGALAVEQALRGLAVRAVGFGEDRYEFPSC